jgi:hypothetical protein
MTYCTALLKSEKRCASKAKYVLEEYSQYYCKMHALAQSNLKLGATHESIETVPNLRELRGVASISDAHLEEILADISGTHGYRLAVVSKTKVKTHCEIAVVSRNDSRDRYMLRVAKSPAYIDQFINASSAYASLLPVLSKPACVPIVSYIQEETQRMCLVRGWRYGHWYYELALESHPLLRTDPRKLISRLVDLIECTHDYRIVHGSIEMNQLVQLKAKRISTTVFESLKNALFWEGRYGQTVEHGAPLDSDFKFDAITCARRLNQKQYPCRYDDFESLLYLAMQMLGHCLPWVEVASNGDILQEKNAFLHSAASGTSPLGPIARMILESHFDDRPNYTALRECFERLAA